MLSLLTNFPSSIHYYFIFSFFLQMKNNTSNFWNVVENKIGLFIYERNALRCWLCRENFILYHFLNRFEARNSTANVVTVVEVIEEGEAAESRYPAMMLTAKLIDGYLSEIASMISSFNDFSVIHYTSFNDFRIQFCVFHRKNQSFK